MDQRAASAARSLQREPVMSEPHRPMTQRSPVDIAFAAACPHCGEGRLFDGYLKLRPRCSACGLDYDFADAGDGPAVFVMMIIGFVVLGAALIVELRLHPPLWLHLSIWLPLATVLALIVLRPLKALMIALQYRNGAAEGRREDGA
jgi:uncharacterized protein (DUF983 family)